MDARQAVREKLEGKILEWQERSRRRVYIRIDEKDLLAAARVLFKELRMRFSTASGIDTPSGFEILYHFSHDEEGVFYSLRVLLSDKKHPEIDSLAPLFPGAEWVEREIWEMLGINFRNHPNLKRLLLAEDWPEGNYPLRREQHK